MELILDTGNIEQIKDMNEYLVLDGITTNPSIVAREKKDFRELISEIDSVVGKDMPIHAQVISTDYEGIMEEARLINGLRENMYVKVPVTKEGLKAIKNLSKEGIKTTATAIFTAHQGFLAAKAGASYVAPYVNRIDNISGNGVEVVSNLINIIDMYGFDTKVVAASFKNAQQVIELMNCGVHSCTVPYDICSKMIEHPLTGWSVDKFIDDWEETFGKGSTTIR